MRSEDTAIHVRLVDDDVAQVLEDVAPAVVVRQEADVDHVRVREDHVRPLADLPAALGLRVPVVDAGAQAREAELGERARLILCERLRRIEIEGAVLRLRRERVQHGEVEGERLAARGSGRDHHVRAARSGLERLGLVGIELSQAAALECFREFRMQARRKRSRPGLACSHADRVDDLLGLEELVPLCDLDRHSPYYRPRGGRGAATGAPLKTCVASHQAKEPGLPALRRGAWLG
jgi:hypothetical protein